jgi:hypothetical protein
MPTIKDKISQLFDLEERPETFRRFLRRTDDYLNLAQGIYGETLLLTAEGPRAVGRIAEGDLVMTFDHGLQSVCGVERFEFARLSRDLPGAIWPLRVAAGLFGNAQERFLAPEQCLLLESDLAESELGDPFVLVPARVLGLLPQVDRVAPTPERVIHRLRFAQPELVMAANGAVLLCETGSIFDHWQGFAEEDRGPLLSYTSLPFDMARDLLSREILQDGGIAAHLDKHLKRMNQHLRAG